MSACIFLCASIIQKCSAFVTSRGMSGFPAFLNEGFGVLWYSNNTRAVTLNSLSKFEYLFMLSLEASVSVLLIWQVCVILYATLTWSGSCSLVKALLIGHSLSGNSRKSGPLCQILSEFRSFGFLPRVSQSAMVFLLSVQYQSSVLVFCCISPTRVAAKVLNPYDSF